MSWYHHFTHIACTIKYRGLRQKLECTSCTKQTISFEVSGFYTETRLLQRDSFLLNLFEPPCFSLFKMHHSKQHHQFSTLSDFICYFSCIYWLFWAIRPWNWKAFEMNSEKVPSWHGIIISPHSMCEKVERVTAKTGCTLCTKIDNLFRSIRVSNENSSVTKRFHFFKPYLNSWLFVCSKCTIQSHIIIFQSFLTSFVIFHAFTNYFEL